MQSVASVLKPTLTRREAQGLVSFARSAFNTYTKGGASLTPFDWYPYALAVLGFEKPGDKFKVDTAFQLGQAPRYLYDQLKAALITMASELDDQSIPFRLVVDPRGTDATYRKLAKDAWAAMQALAKQGAKSSTLAHDVVDWPEVVENQPPVKPKPAPEQLPLPSILPVDAPITVEPAPTKKGSGAWWLLLLAIAGTRKKRGGKRR